MRALSPEPALLRRLASLTETGVQISLDDIRPWFSTRPDSTYAYCHSVHFAADEQHGNTSIAPPWSSASAEICKLLATPALSEFRLTEALFLDIETTGVSHSAGTIPVVIGLGWFQSNGDMKVEQLLLDSPENEAELLRNFSRS